MNSIYQTSKYLYELTSPTDLTNKARSGKDIDIEPLQAYLEKGGLPNIYNSKIGLSVLSLACRHHSTRVLKCLMCSIHLDINMRNGYKRTTALHESTLYGFKEGVRLISEHPETDLNCVDHQGQTATHYAVHAHQTECLRLLLIAGARIDIPCNNGQLPIHMAVMHGYDDCVSLLLDYKDIYHNNPTEINMISKENRLGYSTLEYTIMGGYKHTLDLIINFKSTEEITDKEKWVELTIVWNKIDCLRLLIEQGYPVHLNHLLTAVKQKKIDIVRELSKIVDLINNDNTSLLSAVGYGLLDTIPLLCNTTSKLCTLLNKGE